MSRLFADFSTLEEYLIQKRENNGWQFGEGFNVGSGSHLNKLPNVNELADLTDEELKKRYKIKPFPHRATWITGELNVLPRQLTSKGICWNDVKPCSELFFEAPRIKNKLIFSPPHVLIREVADGLAIPAVFSDSSDSKLVFSKQIIGIHAPNADKEKLVNIANFLNDSGISSFLAIVASGRILISRSSSLLQDDILSVPYSDSNKDIVLTDWENALVEDVMKYYVNFRRCGEDSTVLNDVSNKDLLSFGKMYCNILNPVYKEFRALSPIPMGTFICYPFCYGDTPQIELPKEETVVPYLTELLRHQHGGRLFVNRILRLYEQNVIFMIKPNQKRYWLRSIALRDADETLIDLLDQGF